MSTAYRLTEREVARRLGILHTGIDFWGLARIDANAAGDAAREAEALRCQRALLVEAPPLRRMLAEARQGAAA